jgi:MoxR-like ATPase
MTITTVAERCRCIIETLKQVIVGKDEVLEHVLLGVLANGHILIEDYPGLAKTLIAHLCAQTLDLTFKRIQFTPDLLPSDITRSFLYNQREGTFSFRRGPVFTHLLLADEINRATPKTQAALLEVMQEQQVTVEGEQFRLELPFLVLATQNPVELEGTYPLPEAQLDRFLMRLRVGYPTPEDEQEILERRLQRRRDTAHVPAVTTRTELLAIGVHGPGVVARDAARTRVRRVDPTPAYAEGGTMIWGVVVLLAAIVIAIPLSVILSGTTVALGVVTGLLAVLGAHARSAAVLTVAVACGLLQALAAFLHAGQPPALWLAVLLGSVVYLLLDVAAFAERFQGVAVEARVWHMQVMYWSGPVVLFGLTTLAVGLLAAASARPFMGPLLLHGLAIIAAIVVIGAAFAAIRVWYHEGELW